ncbi:MAG TPA: hypothetical protein DHV14_03970 [Micrococcales bacterium]|uniref:hypothetical protein n=1 Tax=Miniimonas arenae TaxID=676201 RepID=UPI000EEACE32|nr:hypothetical protein [Miniimonas arenae]HCX84294.1 hypothetical protein [Micrococcales bacterium]
MTSTGRPGPGGGARRRQGRPVEDMRRFGGGGVATFGEMIVVGLVVTALSLPVITAVPALAAGVHHLEQHLTDRADAMRDLLRSAWQAIRTGWWVGLLTAVVAFLLALNLSAALQGLVPGGAVLAGATAIIAVALGVWVCRAAALWRPGARWGDLLTRGRELAVADPVGSVYVIVAFGVSAVVVWMLPPLVVLTPGMTAIALVAGQLRLARSGEPTG